MRLVEFRAEKHGDSEANLFVWELADGCLIESSLLYIHGRAVPWVVCLPSSVGCAQGCSFCAVTRGNDPRPLDKLELSAMLDRVESVLPASGRFQVSFMGQGEPLLGAGGVFEFCSHVSARFPRVTIGFSTVGVASGIRRIAGERWAERVRLQLSLHAWPRAKRMQLIPAEETYPFAEAIEEAVRLKRLSNIPVCLNYVLLGGFNDSENDAWVLAELASASGCYVKVSEFNRTSGTQYAPSSDDRRRDFCSVLESRGVEVHRFRSVGTSIGAGCGQTGLSVHHRSSGNRDSTEGVLRPACCAARDGV